MPVRKSCTKDEHPNSAGHFGPQRPRESESRRGPREPNPRLFAMVASRPCQARAGKGEGLPKPKYTQSGRTGVESLVLLQEAVAPWERPRTETQGSARPASRVQWSWFINKSQRRNLQLCRLMTAGFQLYTCVVSLARVAWFQYYMLAGKQWILETTEYSCTEGVRNKAIVQTMFTLNWLRISEKQIGSKNPMQENAILRSPDACLDHHLPHRRGPPPCVRA